MTNQSIELILKCDNEERVFRIDQTETVIGRGKLFEINDKKVSRQHALLLANNGKVTLKSTHSNPCFLNLVNRNKKILLKCNVSVCLEDGDLFSLLHDKYTFQIKIAETSIQNNSDNKTQVPKKDTIRAVDSETASYNDTTNGDCNNDTLTTLSNSSEKNLKCCSNKVENKLSEILSGTSQSTSACVDSFHKPKRSLPTKRKLPQWMVAKNDVNQSKINKQDIRKKSASVSSSGDYGSSKKKSLKKNEKSLNSDVVTLSEPEKLDSNSDNNMPVSCNISSDVEKASLLVNAPSSINSNPQKETDAGSTGTGVNSLFTEDSKKKVTDSAIDQKVGTESSSYVLQLNETPTHSAYASNLVRDNSIEASLATDNNESNSCEDNDYGANNSFLKTREPCAYGKSCYRKNPAHFNEFSHPGDADYFSFSSSDEDRPECEYGLQCYRKNPTHKKMFKHTRRMTPKRTVSAATKAQDSSSDDYDLEDSFIDDGDDDDDDEEIMSDGSDWTPAQNSAAKDKETSSDTEEEDIKGLVSSAKKFTKNKKLWRT